MAAILFGSISTLADTSELQRAAFNAAFAEHGLDWTWSQAEYAELLTGNGGAQRVADVAAERGEDVDAAAVHATKSRLFQERLRETTVDPRPGVLGVVEAAREGGHRLGLVTTTSPENVTALLAALGEHLSADDFDVVLSTADVEQVKPDPEAYRTALQRLGVDAGEAVAVEDNVGGARAASAAGVACVAFPNVNTSGHDFGSTETTEALDAGDLLARAGKA